MDSSKLLESIVTLDTIIRPGDLIDRISTVETENDYKESYKCIGDLLESEKDDRYFFAKLEDMNFSSYYCIEEGNHRYYRESDEYKTSNYTRENMKKILDKHKKPAVFGDIVNQETRVDPKIRKGFDVLIDQEKIYVLVTDKLSTIFRDRTGIKNFRIVPYKINIYEAGDFFVEHRDTPEKDLIATAVVHVDGDYGTMVIDGYTWYEMCGDVLFFYPEVLHEVKPVPNYRETITFKVYKTGNLSNVALPENTNEITKRFVKRVDTTKSFGILLQNGYNYYDILCEDADITGSLKGHDQKILDIVKEIGKTNYYFVPVITVVNYDNLDEDYYHYISSDDEDYEYDEESEERRKIRIKTSKNQETYDGTKDEIYIINVHNINSDYQKILSEQRNMNVKTIQKMPVYYLGKGFKVGERTRYNVFIGNQHTGKLEEDIYMNVLLVVEEDPVVVI